MRGLVQREEMAMNHFLPHEADRFSPLERRSLDFYDGGGKKIIESGRKMALLDSSSTLGFSDSGLSS